AVIGDCYKGGQIDQNPPVVCKGGDFGQPLVAYYRLSHQTPALTCEAEAITVTAFDANNQPIALTPGTQLSLSISPDSGSWSMMDARAPGTRYLRNTPAGSLTLAVGDGAALGHSTIEVRDAALKFYGNKGGDAISHQVAGVIDPDMVIRAVQTDPETGACV